MTTDECIPVSEYSSSLRRICSQILDLSPSCVEFLPGSNSADEEAIENCNEYFVVGTYHLQSSSVEETTIKDAGDADEDENEPIAAPKPQERDGSLSLFRIKDEKL
jgi:hypothetical protein